MATPPWDSHFRLDYQVYSTIRSFHSSRSLCVIVEPSWIFPERLMLAGSHTCFVSLRTALLNEGVFSSPFSLSLSFASFVTSLSILSTFPLSNWFHSPHIPRLSSPLLPQCCFPMSFCPFHPEPPCLSSASPSPWRLSPPSSFLLCCYHYCSVSKSCQTLCNLMNCSTPGFPVLHYLPEFAQTEVHWIGDAIEPSHALLSPSPPALNLSQHQGLFQWVSSSHPVAKVLEFQLQHQCFQ